MNVNRVLRRAVVHTTRGRVFRRRLPQALGGCWFPASVDGGLRQLKPTTRIDPQLTRLVANYVGRGSVVWDVGANVGLFACAAMGLAGLDGLVVAVEPDIWLAQNLRKAAHWNRASGRLHVIPAAIDQAFGVTEFVIARENRAVNYLPAAGGSDLTGGVRELQHVPAVTLDSLLDRFPAPHVLKIDVEGAEARVLSSATRVLRHRPTLLLEVAERNRHAVNEILSASGGYKYRSAETGKLVTELEDNTIAIPHESASGRER